MRGNSMWRQKKGSRTAKATGTTPHVLSLLVYGGFDVFSFLFSAPVRPLRVCLSIFILPCASARAQCWEIRGKNKGAN